MATAVLSKKKKREFEQFRFTIGNSKESPIRYAKLEGREHLVAPCVMLTEGVHEGSQGKGFYSAVENAKSAQSWNHKPVVVYHPEINGKAVSACEPAIINKRKIGVVLKTFHDNKLRTEVWLDIKKTNKVDARIIPNMEAGKIMEVSTGLYARKKKKKGVWNNEAYDWEAKDYAPDHLAILPDKIGACSILDGAGLLQTNQGKPKIMKEAYSRALTQIMRIMNKASNDASFAKITRSVELALRSQITAKGKEWNGWIEEIFSGFVIYYANGSLYKQSYKLSKDGVELTGDKKEVNRVVSYQTAEGGPVGNSSTKQIVNNQKGTDQMATKMKVINRKRVVNNLIDNGDPWGESDREWLMKQPVRRLMKLAACKPEILEVQNSDRPRKKKKAQEPVTPTNNDQQPVTGQPPKLDDFLKTLPPEYAVMVNQGLKRFNQEKTALVTNILNSKLFPFTKEELEAKDPSELGKLASAIKKMKLTSEGDDDPVANWEANAGGPIDNASDTVEEEPLLLPSVRRAMLANAAK